MKNSLIYKIPASFGYCFRNITRKLKFLLKIIFFGKINYKIFQIFSKFQKIQKAIDSSQYSKNEIFNTNILDEELEKLILEYYQQKKHLFAKSNDSISNQDGVRQKISIIFTELYEVGGHTKIIEKFSRSFEKNYKIKLFITRLANCLKNQYKNKPNNLFENFEYDGVNSSNKFQNYANLITSFYNKIINFNPSVLICYSHPDDIIISATLALIKAHSKIKIIYINIQDHHINFGYKFADLIVDARPAGNYLTKEIRGFNNFVFMPLQHQEKENIKLYSTADLVKLKLDLNIKNDEFVTLTGAPESKIFEENSSSYFEMIKQILMKNSKIKHILLTDINTQKNLLIFENIFVNNKDLLDRLIFIKRTPNYEKYFQMCDVFIDSFPQGGALTHIDLMAIKKPTMVKINQEKPFLSFEYYLPKNYKYIFENPDEMAKGVLEFFDLNQAEKQKISEELYDFYLKNYESNVVKQKYQFILDNLNDLTKIYGKNFYEN